MHSFYLCSGLCGAILGWSWRLGPIQVPVCWVCVIQEILSIFGFCMSVRVYCSGYLPWILKHWHSCHIPTLLMGRPLGKFFLSTRLPLFAHCLSPKKHLSVIFYETRQKHLLPWCTKKFTLIWIFVISYYMPEITGSPFFAPYLPFV